MVYVFLHYYLPPFLQEIDPVGARCDGEEIDGEEDVVHVDLHGVSGEPLEI